MPIGATGRAIRSTGVSIPASSILHLDSRALSDPSPWDDQTGEGHDYDSVGGPTLVDAGPNGQQVVRFDGSDDGYLGPSLWSGGQGRTFFILLKTSDTSADDKVFADTTTDQVGSGESYAITPEYSVRVAGGNRVFNQSASGNWEILTIRNPDSGNADNIQAWVNGNELSVSSTTSQSLNTATDPSTIGGIEDGPGSGSLVDFIDMDVAEILATSDELSDSERAGQEQRIADGWGLSI